ncbi:MAG TPA: TfoX/Sxy family protein [Acidimicrobiales bacterium]
MAYDEGLAERIRDVLDGGPGIDERKMFGGIAFLLDGNMAVGIVGEELMVRVGPDAWADALAQPHVREMDFTGRSMKGFVYVSGAGIAEDADLATWVARGTDFAGSLLPK